MNYAQEINPNARLQNLVQLADVNINLQVPITRYIRSGNEIVRLADMCMMDNKLERAYVLYIKYITIFVDKLLAHPEHNTISPKLKSDIKQKLREVIPKTEALKEQLRKQYQIRADEYTAELKARQRLDKEKLEKFRKEEERKNEVALLIAEMEAKAAINTNTILSIDQTKNKNLNPIAPKASTSITDTKTQVQKDKNIPTVDRSTKPSLLMNDHFGLRDIVMPTTLMQNFLTLAFNNTVNNKETCGILAGKLQKNKLLVTHLLIPKQTGSPDSCLTHNEEDIFDYQDQHNLITLGWIHTHPTQTAFLSSVDLHTHCAYQLMMAEAIAIVCAPKYDETGFFFLTSHGLDFIANCRESGFHPHPTEPSLYTEAKHCKLDSSTFIEVVDLRRK